MKDIGVTIGGLIRSIPVVLANSDALATPVSAVLHRAGFTSADLVGLRRAMRNAGCADIFKAII